MADAKLVTRDVHKRITSIHLEWYEVELLLKKHAIDILERDGLLASGAEMTIEVDLKQLKEGGSLAYTVDKWSARIEVEQNFMAPKPEKFADESEGYA